jgi:hypothetical protein
VNHCDWLSQCDWLNHCDWLNQCDWLNRYEVNHYEVNRGYSTHSY